MYKFITAKNVIISIFLITFLFAPSVFAFSNFEYGVFLGINGNQINRLRDYHIVVIEPTEFKKEQIDKLHDQGKVVYGYLNIGAVAEYRSYYSRFQDITLGLYENWPDERWIDVSRPEWQAFIIDELGKQYVDMGFDGFFLDNADVYYHFPSDDIFNGLYRIMKGLKAYDVSLLVNGADVFVSRCMSENISYSLFDGINQETVFTCIDFENGRYGRKMKKETEYFMDYLDKVKNNKIKVYLLEYRAGRALSRKIDEYCTKNGFFGYNAATYELL